MVAQTTSSNNWLEKSPIGGTDNNKPKDLDEINNNLSNENIDQKSNHNLLADSNFQKQSEDSKNQINNQVKGHQNPLSLQNNLNSAADTSVANMLRNLGDQYQLYGAQQYSNDENGQKKGVWDKGNLMILQRDFDPDKVVANLSAKPRPKSDDRRKQLQKYSNSGLFSAIDLHLGTIAMPKLTSVLAARKTNQIPTFQLGGRQTGGESHGGRLKTSQYDNQKSENLNESHKVLQSYRQYQESYDLLSSQIKKREIVLSNDKSKNKLGGSLGTVMLKYGLLSRPVLTMTPGPGMTAVGGNDSFNRPYKFNVNRRSSNLQNNHEKVSPKISEVNKSDSVAGIISTKSKQMRAHGLQGLSWNTKTPNKDIASVTNLEGQDQAPTNHPCSAHRQSLNSQKNQRSDPEREQCSAKNQSNQSRKTDQGAESSGQKKYSDQNYDGIGCADNFNKFSNYYSTMKENQQQDKQSLAAEVPSSSQNPPKDNTLVINGATIPIPTLQAFSQDHKTPAGESSNKANFKMSSPSVTQLQKTTEGDHPRPSIKIEGIQSPSYANSPKTFDAFNIQTGNPVSLRNFESQDNMNDLQKWNAYSPSLNDYQNININNLKIESKQHFQPEISIQWDSNRKINYLTGQPLRSDTKRDPHSKTKIFNGADFSKFEQHYLNSKQTRDQGSIVSIGIQTNQLNNTESKLQMLYPQTSNTVQQTIASHISSRVQPAKSTSTPVIVPAHLQPFQTKTINLNEHVEKLNEALKRKLSQRQQLSKELKIFDADERFDTYHQNTVQLYDLPIRSTGATIDQNGWQQRGKSLREDIQTVNFLNLMYTDLEAMGANTNKDVSDQVSLAKSQTWEALGMKQIESADFSETTKSNYILRPRSLHKKLDKNQLGASSGQYGKISTRSRESRNRQLRNIPSSLVTQIPTPYLDIHSSKEHLQAAPSTSTPEDMSHNYYGSVITISKNNSDAIKRMSQAALSRNGKKLTVFAQVANTSALGQTMAQSMLPQDTVIVPSMESLGPKQPNYTRVSLVKDRQKGPNEAHRSLVSSSKTQYIRKTSIAERLKNQQQVNAAKVALKLRKKSKK